MENLQFDWSVKPISRNLIFFSNSESSVLSHHLLHYFNFSICVLVFKMSEQKVVFITDSRWTVSTKGTLYMYEPPPEAADNERQQNGTLLRVGRIKTCQWRSQPHKGAKLRCFLFTMNKEVQFRWQTKERKGTIFGVAEEKFTIEPHHRSWKPDERLRAYWEESNSASRRGRGQGKWLKNFLNNEVEETQDTSGTLFEDDDDGDDENEAREEEEEPELSPELPAQFGGGGGGKDVSGSSGEETYETFVPATQPATQQQKGKTGKRKQPPSSGSSQPRKVKKGKGERGECCFFLIEL